MDACREALCLTSVKRKNPTPGLYAAGDHPELVFHRRVVLRCSGRRTDSHSSHLPKAYLPCSEKRSEGGGALLAGLCLC